MKGFIGSAAGLGLLVIASAAAAQCDPVICSNPGPSYRTLERAQAHCRNDVVVWQEGDAPVYDLKGSPKFGKTTTGAFMCKTIAVKHGSRPAKTGSARP